MLTTWNVPQGPKGRVATLIFTYSSGHLRSAISRLEDEGLADEGLASHFNGRTKVSCLNGIELWRPDGCVRSQEIIEWE